MEFCDKCGEKLKRDDKFCSNCGDTIIWVELGLDEKVDQLADVIKNRGNDFLDDNLPEEYADKIRENISQFHEISQDPDRSIIDESEKLSNAKQNVQNASKSIMDSGSDFINDNDALNNTKDGVLNAADSFKKSSSDFINAKISDDTQEKIKSNFSNLSVSGKNFTSKSLDVLNNIHSHRANVKKQKVEQKKVQEAYQKQQQELDLAEKERLNQIAHQNTIIEIRETRRYSISIPAPKDKSNDELRGAVTGEMIGSGAGRVIGGIAGDSIIDTIDAGLILGGAGALIGGLLAAGDDGIDWVDSQIYIADSELIISGKFTIAYDDIKLISTAKFKGKDMIVFTFDNNGVEFRCHDAKALKIVIEEFIDQYSNNKKEPSNVDDLLKYAELYEKGIITKDELDLKKKELF